MTQKLTITDLPIEEKKVLMRVDFNVPQDENGTITDDSRIRAALPSIRYVLDRGGSLILMSHLGRPKGERNAKFTLAPVAKRLSELIGREVTMAPDSVGDEVDKLIKALKPGQIVLLENLRFYSAEEKPELDPNFSKKLASYGDLYVNDAFGTAHRAHSSTVTVAKLFPGRAAAGFLLEKEIAYLGKTLLDPAHPFVAIIGGAKVSSKIGVLKSLLGKVDTFLIGGGMAYTFLKANGIKIGLSLFEESYLDEAKAFLLQAKEKGVTVVLPVDIVIANKISESAESEIKSIDQGIPEEMMGVDIGPNTITSFQKVIANAATILWNGPMGVFEIPAFAKGTRQIAQAVADSSATSIIGGGDSVAAIQELGLADQMSHISTGGGASLEYIENGTLPGIEALSTTQKVKN